MNDETRLFSYKLINDSGFAPNPYFGLLTLATCKPGIRRAKDVGDWIAGFTSKQLCGDPVGKERLIFLMQVTEKMCFSRYYGDRRFTNKIPDRSKPQCIWLTGDNIYKTKSKNSSNFEDFEQLPNPNHNETKKEHDLSGEFVLVSSRFFYFGSEALIIPEEIRPEVPKGQSANGVRTKDEILAEKFIRYFVSHCKIGVHGTPHSWTEDDPSRECQRGPSLPSKSKTICCKDASKTKCCKRISKEKT